MESESSDLSESSTSRDSQSGRCLSRGEPAIPLLRRELIESYL